MPYYNLQCEDCGHTEEYFFPLSAWDKCDMSKFETPYPSKCPECKKGAFLRCDTDTINGKVKPGAHKLAENMQKQVREDVAKIRKGDENFIANIAGEKPNKLLGKDIKYAKDVKNPKFKRRQ